MQPHEASVRAGDRQLKAQRTRPLPPALVRRVAHPGVVTHPDASRPGIVCAWIQDDPGGAGLILAAINNEAPLPYEARRAMLDAYRNWSTWRWNSTSTSTSLKKIVLDQNGRSEVANSASVAQ
jgi:hypothetical protein